MSQSVVTVYSKPDCQQCEMTKKWLKQRDIEYQNESILEPDNLEAVKALGYMAAPVVIVSNGDLLNDVHWTGFNPLMLHQNVRKDDGN